MTQLSSSDLYSHPGRLLEDHLVGTARTALTFLSEKTFCAIGGCNLSQLVTIVALCHDLGKATPYFQEYLQAPEKEKECLKARPETRHGLLSAVCSYFAGKQAFKGDKELGSNEWALMPFMAFMVTKKHHGNLDDVLDEVVLGEKKQEVLRVQVDAIEEVRLEPLNSQLRAAGLPVDITKEHLVRWVDEIPKELRKVKRKLRGLKTTGGIKLYLLLNFLFSLLIDADKTDVMMGGAVERRDDKLDHSLVDRYKQRLGYRDTFLNRLREEASREVVGMPVTPNERIFSINLPTGLGKTLTTLSFALRLRNLLGEERGYSPRIIYSLPYLSIIDQNAAEFEKVLRSAGIEVDTNLLLKHHHMADVYYRKDDEEFESDQARLLIEGWNAEIIVTTFVQLFHTLLSYRNSSLRKFHRLANAIIILDEVQSIPFKYWMLVREVLKTLVHELDSYVVLVTATQPLIFRGGEIYPLVNGRRYFQKLGRVVVRPCLESDVTLEEFGAGIDIEEGKSYLFVMNTISAARDLYSLLQEKTGRNDITFLSTHVVPKERMERINNMRRGRTSICVTTQLVEAGVDIDFDVVYRDLAPLDSINQAAGRCNRNWRGRGEVYVVSLVDQKGKKYASYVYDGVLLETTRNILGGRRQVGEEEFLELIETYYCEITDKKSSDESRQLLQALYRLKYDGEGSSIAAFRIIEKDYPKVNTFIEIDDEAVKTWKRYEEIKEIRDIRKRKSMFAFLKADFYRFVLAVPLSVQNLPPEVEGFRYVNKDALRDYYDAATGFICTGVVPIW